MADVDSRFRLLRLPSSSTSLLVLRGCGSFLVVWGSFSRGTGLKAVSRFWGKPPSVPSLRAIRQASLPISVTAQAALVLDPPG